MHHCVLQKIINLTINEKHLKIVNRLKIPKHKVFFIIIISAKTIGRFFYFILGIYNLLCKCVHVKFSAEMLITLNLNLSCKLNATIM